MKEVCHKCEEYFFHCESEPREKTVQVIVEEKTGIESVLKPFKCKVFKKVIWEQVNR